MVDLVLTNMGELVLSVKFKGNVFYSYNEIMGFVIFTAVRSAHRKLTTLNFR